MKSLLLATTTAVGLSLFAMSGAGAAPANGTAIGTAAGAEHLTQQARVVVVERRRHHRMRCWWRHGRRICVR